ncbi:uncharacterized protein LOC111347301 [Stylophora pistillata]|uniref:uncharacterized protein LOC111347301 n=1 Tax=Stylophora pistillata TaxID=50429 RepID=UPI000C04AFAF|nr:uncharacterized protein LOC111347301 [Stylophora pistillata]
MNQAEENKYSEILTLDKDNEDKAIGYILDNEEAALLAIKLINEQSFVCNYNAHIFKLLRVHLGDGKPLSEIYATINSITSDDWKEISPNQDVEKNKHISHCRAVAISLFGSSALAEGLFNKINKQFVRREMLSKYTEAKQSLLNTDGIDDISHVVHNVSEKTNDMLDSIATGTFDKNYADSLLETLNRKEEYKISTGYKKLDEIIEGFGAGQLVTIGAGTGRGKSAFAVNLALNIRDQDYTVGLWSFEMDEHEVKERILSNVTGIGKKDEYRQEERYNLVRKYADKISSEKAGKDPEIRTTNDGKEIANLSIATTESWKDKSSGEKKDKTEWHRVVCFNEGLVRVIKNYVKKGTKLYLEGQLQTKKWIDKDNQEKYTTEVILKGYSSNLVLLGSNSKEASLEQKDNGRYKVGQSKQSTEPDTDIEDDEIPF